MRPRPRVGKSDPDRVRLGDAHYGTVTLCTVPRDSNSPSLPHPPFSYPPDVDEAARSAGGRPSQKARRRRNPETPSPRQPRCCIYNRPLHHLIGIHFECCGAEPHQVGPRTLSYSRVPTLLVLTGLDVVPDPGADQRCAKGATTERLVTPAMVARNDTLHVRQCPTVPIGFSNSPTPVLTQIVAINWEYVGIRLSAGR